MCWWFEPLSVSSAVIQLQGRLMILSLVFWFVVPYKCMSAGRFQGRLQLSSPLPSLSNPSSRHNFVPHNLLFMLFSAELLSCALSRGFYWLTPSCLGQQAFVFLPVCSAEVLAFKSFNKTIYFLSAFQFLVQ